MDDLRERVRLAAGQEILVRQAADVEGRTYGSMVRYIIQRWIKEPSLADDPAACERMVDQFEFLFGDLGRARPILLANMAELIGVAETEEQ